MKYVVTLTTSACCIRFTFPDIQEALMFMKTALKNHDSNEGRSLVIEIEKREEL